MKKIPLIIILTLIFNLISTTLFSLNFLINMFFGILPQPVRDAFKGQGLVNNQFQYGFGNSAFSTIGYLNSDLNFVESTFVDKYKFKNPTYYSYAGYIAHVSTPVFLTVLSGWQLELEVGYGGTDYDSSVREFAQKFYFSGMSGFNWNIYKSPKINKYSWNLNLGFGYKLHSFLKEELYYNTQIGVILLPNILSSSLEYLTTVKGGTFFIYGTSANKSESKEQIVNISMNWLLTEKYVLKFGYVIRNWYLLELLRPNRETKINFYGLYLSLITK